MRLLRVKLKTSTKIFFCIILIICVFAIGLALYTVLLDSENTDKPINKYNDIDEETYSNLKTDFYKLFNNKINFVEEKSIDKENKEKDLVYTEYETHTTNQNYDISVYIPNININNDKIKQYNNEIQEIFKVNAESIIKTNVNSGIFTIYTVQYTANVSNNILSIVIKSNLKEGDNAQRTIVKTYNIDLKTNEQIKLKDILKEKGIDENKAKNKIKEEIRIADKQANLFHDVGYSVYSRDLESSIYELDNSNTFYIDENEYIYVIYPYGNNNFTSEMDLVIF